MHLKIASLLLFFLSPSFAYQFKDGDLILRQSTGYIATQYSKLSDYPILFSHIGIFNNGKIHHIESKNILSINDYHQDDPADFLKDVNRWAIFRSPYGGLIKKSLNQFGNKKIFFDFLLSLDNENLYCTEFIFLILEDIFKNSISQKASFTSIPGITIGNILRSKKFQFKKIIIHSNKNNSFK